VARKVINGSAGRHAGSGLTWFALTRRARELTSFGCG